MIGYYLNIYAGQYQPPANLPWSQYTDMVYFGAYPMDSYRFSFGSDDQNNLASTNMQTFVSIAAQKNVRALFGVGGEQGSKLFSYYMSDPSLRQSFVKSLVGLAQSYGFAGVVISWQSPNDPGVGCNSRSPYDVANLGRFAQEFKSQWSAGRLVVRTSLQGFIGSTGGAARSVETSLLAEYVDYIDLMAYDAYTGKGKQSGPFSLLTSNCGLYRYSMNGIKEALQTLYAQGFSFQKILLGLAGYGRTFQIPNGFNAANGLSQPASGSPPAGGITDIYSGTMDTCGQTRGYEGTYLLQELISNGWLTADTSAAAGSLTRGYDNCAQQPYLYTRNYVLVYDDYQSVTAKAQYVKSLGLPGLSFFDVTGMVDAVYQGVVAAGYTSS